MGCRPLVLAVPVVAVPVLAVLVGAALAGCAHAVAGPGPAAARHATARPAAHLAGPLGGPGNPLALSCAAEAWPGYPSPPAPATPGPHDLAAGSAYFPGGLAVATYTPAQYGYSPFGRHGRFYKLAVVVRPGATVTVTIGARARGHAVIAIGPGGVTAATYHACRKPGGFFAQGFAFTRPPFRGCVPLDLTVSGQARGPSRHAVAVRRPLRGLRAARRREDRSSRSHHPQPRRSSTDGGLH